jgi:hypothetical protein
MVMTMTATIEPFERCPALDGYHCVTNSLAKLYFYHGHPLSEDMLLGLGAGMGFIYWHPKGSYPFIGGRGNTKCFFDDLGRRTGVGLKVRSSGSATRSASALKKYMEKKEPVMVFGDMGYLPWFDLPEGYHFGGHAFVICGYDGTGTYLASDMDPKAGGLKKGFYYTINSDQLIRARSSPHKPFPPKNGYIEADFSGFRSPTSEDVNQAIKQAADAQLHPPIKNFGIKGIRHAAREIVKWPGLMDDTALRMSLFNLYVFIEIGGTGGGCFRPMYARFLEESASITKNDDLLKASGLISEAGALFTEAGLLFKDAETIGDIDKRIGQVSDRLLAIADIEERAFEGLRSVS